MTVAHVINGIRDRSDDGKVLLRLNIRDAPTSAAIASDVDDWIPHPEGPTTDVCALPFSPPMDRFDHRVATIAQIVDDDVVRDEQIAVGDEVFLPGLFGNHPGSERNIPILRTGNIAAMPEEPVKTSLGSMDAYLVESRSIGGLSGSPVFVNLGPIRETPARPPFTCQRRSIYLLGIMHGHWDVTSSDPLMGNVNMGIAIVPPISKVIDIFEGSEVFKTLRRRAEEDAQEEG